MSHASAFSLGRRHRYLLWIALALWGGWCFSIISGNGLTDRFGQVVGADYLQFYTAGKTVLLGLSDKLYDFPFQSHLQQEIIGPQLRYFHAYLNPPFLAWLHAPFASLAYPIAFLAWSGLSLLLLQQSLRWLEAPSGCGPWVAGFFPVFATISFGQNSFLSLALLSLAIRHWENRPCLAGLLAGGVAYKPQLLIGVLIFACFDGTRGRRFIIGLSATGGALILFSLLATPAACSSYLDFSLHQMPRLTEWYDFPTWQLHTLRGFFRLLLPQTLNFADGLTLSLSGAFLIHALKFYQKGNHSLPLSLGFSILLTLVLTPHAMVYDWSLLLIPGFLFWKHAPQYRNAWTSYSVLLLGATLLATPLVQFQLHHFHRGIQIAVPILVYVFWKTSKLLLDPAQVNADSSKRTGSFL